MSKEKMHSNILILDSDKHIAVLYTIPKYLRIKLSLVMGGVVYSNNFKLWRYHRKYISK
jgi:hypothetical protein